MGGGVSQRYCYPELLFISCAYYIYKFKDNNVNYLHSRYQNYVNNVIFNARKKYGNI